MRLIFVGVFAVTACSSAERSTPNGRAAESVSTRTDRRLMPSRQAADSMIATYLDLSSERDRYDGATLERMRMNSGPCVEEMYGDGSSNYWLARGRLLGYEGQVEDTLKARVELLTVAEQVPSTTGVYDSEVRARIKTDTVIMRVVPDSSRQRWQVCGYLSTGFDFGGYGGPENVHFKPPSVTRAQLLRQVDSIRRSAR
jgi:hypothetical protein